jgi:hypothetical protein
MDLITGPVTKAVSEAIEKESESFLRLLYGEPLKEVGLLLKDKISARRFRNLLRTVIKAKG